MVLLVAMVNRSHTHRHCAQLTSDCDVISSSVHLQMLISGMRSWQEYPERVGGEVDEGGA